MKIRLDECEFLGRELCQVWCRELPPREHFGQGSARDRSRNSEHGRREAYRSSPGIRRVATFALEVSHLRNTIQPAAANTRRFGGHRNSAYHVHVSEGRVYRRSEAGIDATPPCDMNQ